MAADTVLSCIQPSGELHVGNYFGAISNWVRLQDSYRCIYGIVDLHAMSLPYRPDDLRSNTQQMVIDLLACGIDPEKSLMFLQSLVSEHSELFWILECVCSYGDLTRQTQFKDKSAQVTSMTSDEFISAALFTYPVLQAADILIYRARYVPVGKDQEQHLELSRSIARRFNATFGQLFVEPEVLATPTPKIQSLANPTKKMSKSLGPKHYIGLFEDDQAIRAKVRAAVTDTGDQSSGTDLGPGVANLLSILRACGRDADADALSREYEQGERKYSPLKEAVTEALIALISPMRERRAELARDTIGATTRVRSMSAQAREMARETLHETRRLVGLPVHLD